MGGSAASALLASSLTSLSLSFPTEKWKKSLLNHHSAEEDPGTLCKDAMLGSEPVTHPFHSCQALRLNLPTHHRQEASQHLESPLHR